MRKFVITTLAVMLLMGPGLVTAASETPNSTGDTQGNQNQRPTKAATAEQAARAQAQAKALADRLAARCAEINKRIDSKIARGDKRELHVDQLQARLRSAIDRLKADGYDTAKLESDLPGLKSRVDKFQADFAALAASVQSARTLDCGSANREQLLASVRSLLTNLGPTLKQDREDIQRYYRDVVRPDLQALRAQKRLPKGAQ